MKTHITTVDEGCQELVKAVFTKKLPVHHRKPKPYFCPGCLLYVKRTKDSKLCNDCNLNERMRENDDNKSG